MMKVTCIKEQFKKSNKYSIFIDGLYALSLNADSLIESKLVQGQQITSKQLADFKRLSTEDELYSQALRYVVVRPRTIWEFEQYLKSHKASNAVVLKITNKLLDLDLISDKKFTTAFIHDQQRLRFSSKRKIIFELKSKHIKDSIIEEIIEKEASSDQIALKEIIAHKRRIARYRDDKKLLQYLANQGFGYNDIKEAFLVEQSNL